MPETYRKGDFLFLKCKEDDTGAYYNITNIRHGKQWDYNHKFNSIAEMDYYASVN